MPPDPLTDLLIDAMAANLALYSDPPRPWYARLWRRIVRRVRW
jgi:hypothetical protein